MSVLDHPSCETINPITAFWFPFRLMATTANEIDLQPDEGLSTLMEYYG
jgi:hypothetical protein